MPSRYQSLALCTVSLCLWQSTPEPHPRFPAGPHPRASAEPHRVFRGCQPRQGADQHDRESPERGGRGETVKGEVRRRDQQRQDRRAGRAKLHQGRRRTRAVGCRLAAEAPDVLCGLEASALGRVPIIRGATAKHVPPNGRGLSPDALQSDRRQNAVQSQGRELVESRRHRPVQHHSAHHLRSARPAVCGHGSNHVAGVGFGGGLVPLRGPRQFPSRGAVPLGPAVFPITTFHKRRMGGVVVSCGDLFMVAIELYGPYSGDGIQGEMVCIDRGNHRKAQAILQERKCQKGTELGRFFLLGEKTEYIEVTSDATFFKLQYWVYINAPHRVKDTLT